MAQLDAHDLLPYGALPGQLLALYSPNRARFSPLQLQLVQQRMPEVVERAVACASETMTIVAQEASISAALAGNGGAWLSHLPGFASILSRLDAEKSKSTSEREIF